MSGGESIPKCGGNGAVRLDFSSCNCCAFCNMIFMGKGCLIVRTVACTGVQEITASTCLSSFLPMLCYVFWPTLVAAYVYGDFPRGDKT